MPISLKYCSQICLNCVSEHFSFVEIIHPPQRVWHIKMLIRQHDYCTGVPEGGRAPNKKRSAVLRRAMSLKFKHIVFYGCTHTGGVIRRLSAVPSNDSECCSNSCHATERHLHCFILNNIFVSNRC